VSTVEREEGGRQRSGAVKRNNGGWPGVVYSATVEDAAPVRAQRRGRDAAVERKVRVEIFVF
jgi:ribosomal protein L25 (general stress protein Ctc)